MGKKGPRPTPARLKLLRGNPGRRPVEDRTPRPARGVPKAPPHLSKEAKAEWKRVTAELDAAGLLTRADRAALAAYCVVWARWVEAETALAAKGPVYATAEGNLAQNPWLWVCNKALDQLRAYAVQFGLSPASRTRLEAPPPPPDKEENAFDAWLNGTDAPP
jgi:P27 family predicted phage terminase small subunit